MRLSIQGFAAASAVIWGGAILLTGLANMCWPGYGMAFLEMSASIYPGYEINQSVTSVLIGTVYGVVDGAVCGAIFALLYNLFARQ